ncbi:unnamed protein product [Adineta steineri]|uniref:Uncharacterized protein n=1 Tax=Adineta steineri TaxID=433720 RepID=A0A819I8L4_9BILA|nr:unnamed protein product [Adineta steineri]CAF3912540.1 unnamed protein product [Adineta steineri]
MPSNAVILSVLMVMLLISVDVSSSARITLYEHSDHKGWILTDHTITKDDYRCFNLGSWGQDQATSVNTYNDCFILYEHNNCQGAHMKVAPGHGCHRHFPTCGFNDLTSSYKKC